MKTRPDNNTVLCKAAPRGNVPAIPQREIPATSFIARDLQELSKVPVKPGEWLGVYRCPPLGVLSQIEPIQEMLCTSRSPKALCRKLRKLKNIAVIWPVMVLRATSRAALQKEIKPGNPDRFMVQMQRANAAVGTAWKIVRNSMRLYSEVERKRARDFLCNLGNACRSEGKPRGDRATGRETRRAIEIFRVLANGKTPKDIAVDEGAGEHYQKRSRSISITAARFAKRIAKAVRGKYGPKRRTLNYTHLFHALSNCPGFDQVDRHRDRAPLMEAARQGLPGVNFVE